jgi:hypothetical protein
MTKIKSASDTFFAVLSGTLALAAAVISLWVIADLLSYVLV